MNEDKSRILIHAKIKIAVLVCITTISTLLLIILSLIIGAISSKGSDSIGLLLNLIDGLINIICLIFQIGFFNSYYKKFCLKCHKSLDSTTTEKEIENLSVVNAFRMASAEASPPVSTQNSANVVDQVDQDFGP